MAQAPENTPATEQTGEATSTIANKIPEFSDWLPASIRPYWEVLDQYPVVGALAIAVIFLIIAYLVRAILIRAIHKLTRKTSTTLDDAIVQLLSGPIFKTVFIIGLTLATVAARLSDTATSVTINILLSIIVIIWIKVVFRLSGLLFRALAGLSDRYRIIEERTIPLFDIIAKLGAILFGSYALLMIWGINPVGWLASAGIVGIAVGFAAKDTLANLFSGFFILADSPYAIGDFINLDSGERGRVTHVGMRSTRLLTRDDIEITVPNGVIANAKIINESGGPSPSMRVRVAVGAAYGSDVDKVSKVLLQVTSNHKDVAPDPAARVRMRAFGASSLDFELLCWILDPQDRGRIRHELYMAVYKAFAEAGIEIPYAKRDVYIKEMPDRPT